MKKEVNKIRFTLTGRQKFSLKLIRKIAAYTAAFSLLLAALFYFSDYTKARANINPVNFEFRELPDQVFTNEMALPAPMANSLKLPGENTIYTQKVKSVSSSEEH